MPHQYLGALEVESRSGAVTFRFRFQIPLIKLDVRFSRIQLPDKGYVAFAHGLVLRCWLNRVRPSVSERYSSGKRP